MSFLQIWLAGTGGILTLMFLWAFAPVVVFVLLLTGAMGIGVAGIVRLARALERRRN